MAGLVADYGSSGSESDAEENPSEDGGLSHDSNAEAARIDGMPVKTQSGNGLDAFFGSEARDEDEGTPDDSGQVKQEPGVGRGSLRNPFLDAAQGKKQEQSVFTNPFREAEEAKLAMLEKHVKMAPDRANQLFINGKKVCINYRKGRCRFGHNCKFAHDSDIEHGLGPSKTMAPGVSTVERSPSIMPDLLGWDPSVVNRKNAEEEETEETKKRKMRTGLGDQLNPSKKVMKFYTQQKTKECPWVITSDKPKR